MKRKIYHIKSSILYSSILLFILLVLLAFYKNDLYEMWKIKNGMENIKYNDLKSLLKNQDECYLCGNSNRSLINYYHKESEIGIICLNNWYVTDFRVEPQKELQNSGVSSTRTKIEGISIYSDAIPTRGIASIDVSFLEGKQVDYEMLKKNLCQSCLNKVVDVLEYTKWKVEDKEPVPLCLIDFESLDLYSLQYVSCKYSIRDYWVVSTQKEKEVVIDAYNMPYN